MSTNQGGGDFQQGNCPGFRFSNPNQPVQCYISPQTPAQSLLMGDSHGSIHGGDVGTGSFAKFQQFLEWKCRNESISANCSLNSSFGQQSTSVYVSDTSHVPTLMSTPNDVKTKHAKRKHRKHDVSVSSSSSEPSDSESDSSSSSESDGSYHRKKKNHSQKSRKKSHKKSCHKRSHHRRSRSRSRTPPKSRSKRSQSRSPSPSPLPKKSTAVSVMVSANPSTHVANNDNAKSVKSVKKVDSVLVQPKPK